VTTVVDREAILSNAKYLRAVRPVDPGEICEYVEGTPHPAVVRQVLREAAVELGLIERADGTFVPAPEGTVPPRGWRPAALPRRYGDAVESELVERYGPDWARGKSGDHLRETVRRLKADYFHENPVEYDADVALAYAVYHLPDYYAAVGYVLEVLAEPSLLARRLRVLDVGAGSGGPALGLHDYLFGRPGEGPEDDAAVSGEASPDPGPESALVEYHGVEPSAAADLFEAFLDGTSRNFHPRVHRETAEAHTPEGEFDLVVFANVLSELDDPAAVVERYLDALASDGTMLLLAPADRNTATNLRAVERAVEVARSDVTVFAPTLRLWPDAVPDDRGWSFDRGADVEPPRVQRRLDEAGGDPGAFTNETVQFSYALLRTDGTRRAAVRADPDRHARMAEMERHVTNRVNLLAVKLSHDLSEGEGANPVFLVGDGSQTTDHYAVLTRETGLNRTLSEAPYGAVLSVEAVLVLWNDDEGAYNLVVDEETVVDRVA
jgi:SAM-dependent methyltransferase